MLTNLKPRLYAIAIVALAVLATGAVASAVGATGGIGTRSSGGTDSTASTGTGDGANARINDRFTKIWNNQVSWREKRWAHRTSDCESGSDPDAIGGGGAYRGAFQFMRSTWKAAPKSPGGDPIAYPYRTQAVVAVLLKRADGAGHWPVCGR
jgi:transglycosylase-like protein